MHYYIGHSDYIALIYALYRIVVVVKTRNIEQRESLPLSTLVSGILLVAVCRSVAVHRSLRIL